MRMSRVNLRPAPSIRDGSDASPTASICMPSLPADSRQPPDPPSAAGQRTISSRELLGAQKEVVIEHRGEFYRLRLTSLGKLILTK